MLQLYEQPRAELSGVAVAGWELPNLLLPQESTAAAPHTVLLVVVIYLNGQQAEQRQIHTVILFPEKSIPGAQLNA